MCGRYGGPAELAVYSGYLPVDPPFKQKLDARRTRSEYRPSDRAPVFARNSQGEIDLIEMRFGLVPHWHSGTEADWKPDTFNARLEGISETKSFRDSWHRKRRVAVPATDYSEWVKVVDVPGGKVRLDFTRAGNQPLTFAGIWDYHAATKLLSFALITRAPGSRMSYLHPREPVSLDPEQIAPWLNGSDDIDLHTPWGDQDFRGVIAPSADGRLMASGSPRQAGLM